MSVTQERFEQGLTYEAYKAQMTRNRERLEANEQTVTFAAEDLAFFTQLPQPLNVLTLAEDWCGDVINNLPVVGRLAAESGKLNLRIFLRDQNLDLIDQYLKDGQFRSIPVFVFFDAAFHELGHWIERPARISELQGQMRRDLFAYDPLVSAFAPDTPPAQLSEEARARLQQANSKFREENRDFADREVVRELRAVIEHGVAQKTGSIQHAASLTASSRSAAQGSVKDQAKVSITYCAECGYEPQTLALTSALMHEFVHELASIEIIPWQDGTFDVVINGDLVHSMYRDGGFPENETIIRAMRERLA
jgi:selT/selW/selH-like putative selenoprotein